MSHLGIERNCARKAVELALEPAKFEDLKRHRPFSLVKLLEDFGGPTESARLNDVVDHCETQLRGILARPSTNAVAENDLRPLWQCVRSHTLTLRLRRVLNSLIAKFSGFQADGGYWVSNDMPDRRTTAMMAVILQRLGNDNHRRSIRDAVIWLCRHPDYNEFLSGSSDVVAATLTCEAVRPSGMLSQLGHITDATDSWILASQSPMGEWRSEGWEHVDTTVLVLDYFSQASSMLEQVDGFLLMSRDFFRKAEELAFEGGVNNRRLATISSVQAVEMFLYGLFEQRDDLGISAFVDKGDQTLGPRDALAVLQRRLQEEGLLAANRKLSH